MVKSNEKYPRMCWKRKELARDLIGVCACLWAGGLLPELMPTTRGQLGQLFWLHSHEIHQSWESGIDNVTARRSDHRNRKMMSATLLVAAGRGGAKAILS